MRQSVKSMFLVTIIVVITMSFDIMSYALDLPQTPLVTVLAFEREVNVKWESVTGAESYNVKKSTQSGGPYTELASGIIGLNYVDKDVENGNIYYYIVTAVNSAGEGVGSSEIGKKIISTRKFEGSDHSIFIKSNRNVWAWGRNDYGLLGNGITIDESKSLKLNNFDGMKMISAGFDHNLLLKEDGTVWSWGNNNHGQLGNGTTTVSSVPVQVLNLSQVETVSGGSYYSMALKKDGTVWSWGVNSSGELGNGTKIDSSTAVKVSGLNDIVSISASAGGGVALKVDGTVWNWGVELGNGPSIIGTTPVQIHGLNNIISINSKGDFVMAIKEDGTVWAWGRNQFGQLGDGTTVNKSSPVQVTNLDNVMSIKTGSTHSIALKEDGTVWTWGNNSYGQLGDDTTEVKTTPVQVTNLNNVVAIGAGRKHTMALKSDGTVWTWGYNADKQLGYITTPFNNHSTPKQVIFPIEEPLIPLNLTAISNAENIELSWDSVEKITGYNVRRSTTSGSAYSVIASNITGTTFTDSDVVDGITYYYVVTALNEGMESENSNEVSGMLSENSNTNDGNALLVITLSNGLEKEYELPMTDVNLFIAWYDTKATGVGPSYYIMDKSYNLGPFSTRKDYIVFDKILTFEVMSY